MKYKGQKASGLTQCPPPWSQWLCIGCEQHAEKAGDYTIKSENLFFWSFSLISQVDLSFSPAQTLPASRAHLRVTASPQSLCALRAVDQSVLLMKPEAELSPTSVSSLSLRSGRAGKGLQATRNAFLSRTGSVTIIFTYQWIE